MKKIIFLMVLIFGLVSFGETMEITIPNANLENKNGVITYKGKPYTGRLKANLVDEEQGYEGFLSFNEGHFEGFSELKNEKQKVHIKFTVTNGKFDGEVISKVPQIGETRIVFNEGKLVSENGSFVGGTEINLTYTPEGIVNGTMEMNDQTFNFKNGEAKFGQGKMIAKIDYKKQILAVTVIEGKTVVQKIEQPIMTLSMFEKMLFPVLTSKE